MVIAMPQSLAKILVHGVFSTKERRLFMSDAHLRTDLHAYLGGTLATLNCQPLIVGGVEDHVHFLCALSRTITVAEMMKEVKRVSNLWIKMQHPALSAFEWQNGYGAFSIGQSQEATLRQYIANQESHHRKMTFQDEFRKMLKKYGIDFDERYVWD
jgi:REP element-mobilizing transposase RayT